MHMNAFLPRAELPDFELYPGGMSPREIVDWVHARQGVVSYNHVFGTPIITETRTRLQDQGRAMAVDNRIFGADLLEVGYPQRVEPLVAHLGVWDELSASRVFLTAIGSSDSHDQEEGWFDGNNFITWIWARSPQAEDLIDGLRRGRAFLGDPNRFQGTLDLASSGGHHMGRVIYTDRTEEDVRLRLTGVPEGVELRWIVDGSETGRQPLSAGDSETAHRVALDGYRFVRAELWQGERGLAFSNCLYFVPASTEEVPRTPRLVEAR